MQAKRTVPPTRNSINEKTECTIGQHTQNDDSDDGENSHRCSEAVWRWQRVEKMESPALIFKEDVTARNHLWLRVFLLAGYVPAKRSRGR